MRKYATTLFLGVILDTLQAVPRQPFVGRGTSNLDLNGADRGLDSEAWLWLADGEKSERYATPLRRAGFAVEEIPAVPKAGAHLVIRRGTAVFVCPRCKGERYQVNRDTGRKKLCPFCNGCLVPQGVPQGVSYALRLYVASIRAVIASDPSIAVSFGLNRDEGLDTLATLVMGGDAATPVTLMLRAAGFEVERMLSDDHPALLTVRRGTAVFVCPRCKGESSERLPSNGEPPCGFCLRRDLTPEAP